MKNKLRFVLYIFIILFFFALLTPRSFLLFSTGLASYAYSGTLNLLMLIFELTLYVKEIF